MELVFPGLEPEITDQAVDDFCTACEELIPEDIMDKCELQALAAGFCVRGIPQETAEALAREFFVLIHEVGAVESPIGSDESPYEWLVDQNTMRR